MDMQALKKEAKLNKLKELRKMMQKRMVDAFSEGPDENHLVESIVGDDSNGMTAKKDGDTSFPHGPEDTSDLKKFEKGKDSEFDEEKKKFMRYGPSSGANKKKTMVMMIGNMKAGKKK